MPDPVPAVPIAEDIDIDVLYEDGDLILVNKKAGMAVHPAPGSWTGTLVNALLHHCEGALPGIGGVERPGIVHRIDKDTTGVLAVAKTEVAHKALSRRFADHDIERSYVALVRGTLRPRSGKVTGSIGRAKTDRKKMAVVPDGDGKPAITHYEVRESFGRVSKIDPTPAASLVECRLETGRTHQIRVHMAHAGHSLIGDPIYARHRGIKAFGSGPLFDDATGQARRLTRQALHAASLGFPHPVTGEPIFVEAPLPPDLSELLAALRRMP
ncbi:MAG: RluA family pseudouridine synthase [Pseudomonadota bacterium]